MSSAYLGRGGAEQWNDLESAALAGGVVDIPGFRADIAHGLVETLVRWGSERERWRACALAGEVAASYWTLSNKEKETRFRFRGDRVSVPGHDHALPLVDGRPAGGVCHARR